MNAHPADQPLDGTDTALLADLARLYDTVDPVPPGLVERLTFAVALDELHAEVAEMQRLEPDLAGVRAEPRAERAETLTFAADALTAMLTVTHTGPDRVRLDGWVAPAQSLLVRLQMRDGREETRSDDTGRFSFDGVPNGFVQLSFHPDEGEDGATAVVTPSFEL